MLEPYEGKLSRTVLRGERGSNTPDLPDRSYNIGRYANRMKQAVCKTVALGLVGSSPALPTISRFGRIGKCTCLLSRGRLVRRPGAGPGSGVLKKACRPHRIKKYGHLDLQPY